MKKTLYKAHESGKILEWTIEVKNDQFIVSSGQKGGKITTTKPTICKGKNIGRSNETTPQQQALNEAQSKITKKQEKGYTEDIKKIHNLDVFQEPMLAHPYKKHKKKVNGKKIASQPKLDGIRCVIDKNGIYTRNGKPIPACPHIEALGKQIIGDKNIRIDGELYNHKLKDDFNELISIVRKQKPKPEDIQKANDNMQLYVFDMQFFDEPDLDFYNRFIIVEELIKDFNHPDIILTETTFFDEMNQEVDDLYGQYIEDGFEGQMIRIQDSIYVNKRSYDLLKRKEFDDDEFEIVDICEGVGNRSGMMGHLYVKLKDGQICKSSARGNYKYYKELLDNKDQYIGQMATIRFQGYTPDGILRFPVMIAIRDYE